MLDSQVTHLEEQNSVNNSPESIYFTESLSWLFFGHTVHPRLISVDELQPHKAQNKNDDQVVALKEVLLRIIFAVENPPLLRQVLRWLGGGRADVSFAAAQALFGLLLFLRRRAWNPKYAKGHYVAGMNRRGRVQPPQKLQVRALVEAAQHVAASQRVERVAKI